MSRADQLNEATAKRDAARTLFNSLPTWNKAKRDAAEDLDFWVGKVSFLTNWAAS